MRILVQGAMISFLFGILVSCTAAPATPSVAPPSTEAQASHTADVAVEHGSDVGSCPVTEPRRVENVRDGMTFDPSYRIGGDTFWTFVASDNIIRAPSALIQPDGSMRVKWPWLYTDMVQGDLTVMGRLLNKPDASATPYTLIQDINSVEFPDLKPGIQASTSYMVFPAEGCWEVTATKGTERFRFVTQVIKPGT